MQIHFKTAKKVYFVLSYRKESVALYGRKNLHNTTKRSDAKKAQKTSGSFA